MLTFGVNLILEIASSILSGDAKALEYVKEILIKFNVIFNSEEELIDVCLLSLSIISYSMVKRTDLMTELDKVIM